MTIHGEQSRSMVKRESTEVGFALTPSEQLANAAIAAKALKEVIANKPKPVIFNGEQYLEFDDWQTCGQFYGYTVKTGEAEMAEIDGVKGAKAHADLIDLRTGLVVGGAEAYCMRDEENWNKRPKYEWQGEGDNRKRVKIGDEVVPWFQLASMAQTRAGSKAFRNRLAWVVVLAGFKATPAEEMTESTVSQAQQERRTVDKSAHYCSVHNANFFKRGRMKNYAHPIEGTKDWCNEPDNAPNDATAGKAPPETATESSTSPEQEKPVENENKPQTAQEAPMGDIQPITGQQIEEIRAISKQAGLDRTQIEACMLKTVGHTITKASSEKEAQRVIEALPLWRK